MDLALATGEHFGEQVYAPPRSLRSAAECLLKQPPSRTSYGDRAFSVVGPRLWNSLPIYIRNCDTVSSFKSCLKTFLFRQAFPDF